MKYNELKPNISIIIPVYNVEKYINDCMNSVLNNEIDKVEVILVDDGSEDKSGIICDDYAKRYNNVYAYHKSNGGLSDARNYGLLKAKGDYVLFIDSDDMISTNAVKDVIDAINDSHADIIIWDANIIDENGLVCSDDRYNFKHNGLEGSKLYTRKQFIQKQIASSGDYVTTVWLGAYKRSFLIENAFFFEKGLLHEDEMWSQKVYIQTDSFYYISKTLYSYRKRSNSITNASIKNYHHNLLDLIYIYNTLFCYIDHSKQDNDIKKIMNGNIAKRYLHALYYYDMRKYMDLRTMIHKYELLKASNGIKDTLRSLLVFINLRLYCFSMRLFVKDCK